MWDTASYIIAAISAERLGLIDRSTLDSRMSQLLASMAKMPLFEGKLPNKSYNTKTLTMSNYANKDTAKGIGYSAIDMGRILIALQALNKHYPNHAAEVKQVVSRWTLAAMVHDGLLFGAFFDKNGGVVNVQEGRLGYEQYAAKAVKLFKFDAATALNYQKYLSYVDVYGIQVPIDVRDAKTGAIKKTKFQIQPKYDQNVVKYIIRCGKVKCPLKTGLSRKAISNEPPAYLNRCTIHVCKSCGESIFDCTDGCITDFQ